LICVRTLRNVALLSEIKALKWVPKRTFPIMRLTGTWLHSSWRVAFGSVELLCWIGRLTDNWRGPMESKIIFDVSAKAFPWQFIWASVASLVVGGLLVFLKNLKFRRFSQIVGYFMMGSAFISAAYN